MPEPNTPPTAPDSEPLPAADIPLRIHLQRYLEIRDDSLINKREKQFAELAYQSLRSALRNYPIARLQQVPGCENLEKAEDITPRMLSRLAIYRVDQQKLQLLPPPQESQTPDDKTEKMISVETPGHPKNYPIVAWLLDRCSDAGVPLGLPQKPDTKVQSQSAMRILTPHDEALRESVRREIRGALEMAALHCCADAEAKAALTLRSIEEHIYINQDGILMLRLSDQRPVNLTKILKPEEIRTLVELCREDGFEIENQYKPRQLGDSQSQGRY